MKLRLPHKFQAALMAALASVSFTTLSSGSIAAVGAALLAGQKAQAFVDTTWSFEENLAPSYPSGGSISSLTNTYTGGTETYVDSGMRQGDAVAGSDYVLTADLGKALTFTDGTYLKEGGSSYWANGAGQLAVGSTAPNSYTVMAWVKFDSLNGELQYFGTGDNNNSGVAFGLQNGKLDLLVKGKKHYDSYGETAGLFQADTWVNIAFTYDKGTGVSDAYVNGVKVGSVTGLNTVAYANPGGQCTYIGAASTNSAQDNFTGAIAEFSIFDGALSQRQILTAAHLGSADVQDLTWAGTTQDHAWTSAVWTKAGSADPVAFTSFSNATFSGTTASGEVSISGNVIAGNISIADQSYTFDMTGGGSLDAGSVSLAGGVTLNVKGGNLSSTGITGTGTLNITDGARVSNGATTASSTLKLSGTGTYALAAGSLNMTAGFNNDWTGTVQLTGVTLAAQNLNSYGVAGSTVEINGTTGYIVMADTVFNPMIKLSGDGLTITQGSSGKTYTFQGGMSGTGDFNANFKSQTYVFTGDVRDWTGVMNVTASSTNVKFGGAEKVVNAGLNRTGGDLTITLETDTTFNQNVTATDFANASSTMTLGDGVNMKIFAMGTGANPEFGKVKVMGSAVIENTNFNTTTSISTISGASGTELTLLSNHSSTTGNWNIGSASVTQATPFQGTLTLKVDSTQSTSSGRTVNFKLLNGDMLDGATLKFANGTKGATLTNNVLLGASTVKVGGVVDAAAGTVSSTRVWSIASESGTNTLEITGNGEYSTAVTVKSGVNLAMSGSGTQKFTGNVSAFSGSLTVNSGILEITNAITATELTGTGGTLHAVAGLSVGSGSYSGKLDTPSLTVTGSGLTLADGASLGQALTLAGGTLNVGADADDVVTFGGEFTNNGTINLVGQGTIGGDLASYTEVKAAQNFYYSGKNAYAGSGYITGTDAHYQLFGSLSGVSGVESFTLTNATRVTEGYDNKYVFELNPSEEPISTDVYYVNGNLTYNETEMGQANTLSIKEGAVLTAAADAPEGNKTLIGSGTYALTDGTITLPSHVSLGTAGEWTGAVRVSNYGSSSTCLDSGIRNLNLPEGSRVDLNGVNGYFNGTDAGQQVQQNIVLTNTANGGAAVEVTNGNSGKKVVFTGTWSGEGDFLHSWGNANSSGDQTYSFQGDITAWEGSFTAGVDASGRGKGNITLEILEAAQTVNADIRNERPTTMTLKITNSNAVTVNGNIIRSNGTLDVNVAANTTFTGELVGLSKMTVNDGYTATIQNTATIGTLSGAGDLVVSTSAGNLALTSASSDFSGDVTVGTGATLSLLQANSLDTTGALTFESGSTLDLSHYRGTISKTPTTVASATGGITGFDGGMYIAPTAPKGMEATVTLGGVGNNEIQLSYTVKDDAIMHLYILTGQSNSLGAVKGKPLPADLIAAYQSVGLLWNGNMHKNRPAGADTNRYIENPDWQIVAPQEPGLTMDAGTYAGNPCMGPEYGFSYILENKGWTSLLGENDTLAVVKGSLDGGGNGYWLQDNNAYQTLLDNVKLSIQDAVTMGYKNIQLEGLMYLQGESNSDPETAVADTRFADFLSYLTEDLNTWLATDGAPKGVTVTFADNAITGENFSKPAVSQKFLDAATSNGMINADKNGRGHVLTKDLEGIGDGLHFAGNSQLTIGARYAYAFAVQKGVNVGAVRGQDDSKNLNDAGAWWMEVLPGANEVATWDISSVSTVNNIADGQTLTVGGIKIDEVYNATATAKGQGSVAINGGAVSLGQHGINLVGGDLSITSAVTVRESQTWQAQNGHALAVNGTTTISEGATLSFADDLYLTFGAITGTGNLAIGKVTFDMDMDYMLANGMGEYVSSAGAGENGFFSGNLNLVKLTGANSQITFTGDGGSIANITKAGELASHNLELSSDKKALQLTDLQPESTVYYARSGAVEYTASDAGQNGIYTAQQVALAGSATNPAVLTLSTALKSGVTIKSEGLGGTINIASGVSLAASSVNAAAAPAAITGAGEYTANTISGVTGRSFTLAEAFGANVTLASDWSGSVVLSGGDTSFSKYTGFGNYDSFYSGHEVEGVMQYSTIVFNGLNVYLDHTKNTTATINANIEMRGTEDGGTGTALLLTAGNTTTTVFTGKVSGAGNLVFDKNSGGNEAITFEGDLTNWTGALTTGNHNSATLNLTLGGSVTNVNAAITRPNGSNHPINVTVDADNEVAFNAALTDLNTFTVNSGKSAVLRGESSIGTLSGSGSFKVDSGSNVVTVRGGDFSGSISVISGKLVASSLGSASVTVGSGSTLDLAAVIGSGDLLVKDGATLMFNGADKLTVTGTLTLESGSRLDLARIFETQEAPVQANLFQAAPKASSLLSVGGNSGDSGLLSGGLLGAATPAPGDYILATANSIGSLDGVELANIAQGYTGTLKALDAGGSKQLILTLAATGNDLIWDNHSGDGYWNVESSNNWHTAGGTEGDSQFTQDANVTFQGTSDSVELQEAISAGTMTLEDGANLTVNTKEYTLTVTDLDTLGTPSLTKDGTGSATFGGSDEEGVTLSGLNVKVGSAEFAEKVTVEGTKRVYVAAQGTNASAEFKGGLDYNGSDTYALAVYAGEGNQATLYGESDLGGKQIGIGKDAKLIIAENASVTSGGVKNSGEFDKNGAVVLQDNATLTQQSGQFVTTDLTLGKGAVVNLNAGGANTTIATIGSISGKGEIHISSQNRNRTYNITGDIEDWTGAITQASTAGSMYLNISGTEVVNADITNSAKTNPASILTLNLKDDMTMNGKVTYTAVAPIDMNVGDNNTPADVSFTDEVKVRNLNVANAGSSATFEGPTQINGTISGNGEMTVNSGSNTVTVEGANNLKGDTTVTAGTLQLNGGGDMGAVTVNGGEFNTTGAQAITLNSLTMSNGTAHVGNSGNVNLGTVSLTGGDLVLNTAVSAGSLTTTSGATLTFAGADMLTTTGNIDLSGGLQLDLSNITYRTDTSAVQTITLATTSGAINLEGGTFTFLNTKTAEGTASFTLRDDHNNHLVLDVVYHDVTDWPENTKVSYTYTPQGGTEQVSYDIKVGNTDAHGYNFSQADGGVVEFNPNLFDNETHTYTDGNNIVMHSDTTIVVEEGNTVKLTGQLQGNGVGDNVSGNLTKDGAGTLEMAINSNTTGSQGDLQNIYEGSVDVLEGTLRVVKGKDSSLLAAANGTHVTVDKDATLIFEDGNGISIPTGHRGNYKPGDNRSVVLSAAGTPAIVQNAYISQDGVRPEDAQDGGRASLNNLYEFRIGNLQDTSHAISVELADITTQSMVLNGAVDIEDSDIKVSGYLDVSNTVGAPNKIHNNSTINFTGNWGHVNNTDVDKTSKINYSGEQSEYTGAWLTGQNKIEVGSTANGGVATRVIDDTQLTIDYTSDQYKGMALGSKYYPSELSLSITLSDLDMPEDLTGYKFTLTFEDFDTSYVFGTSGEYVPLADSDLNVSLFIPEYTGGQWEELVANVQAMYDPTSGNTVFMFQNVVVPEPTTGTLSLLALCALAARRRRK